MMYVISRGARAFVVSAIGGNTINNANLRPSRSSVSNVAPGAAPTSGVHDNSKSRDAGTVPSDSVT